MIGVESAYINLSPLTHNVMLIRNTSEEYVRFLISNTSVNLCYSLNTNKDRTTLVSTCITYCKMQMFI